MTNRLKQFLWLSALAVVTGPALAGDVAEGRRLFERKWADTTQNSGLGPLYNEASCASCHKEGGGARFVVGESGDVAAAGGVLRLASASGRADPHYGEQLQNKAIAGVKAEGRVFAHLARGDDGLNKLVLRIEYAGAPPGADILPSLRVAPPLRAAAGIARISESAILANVDPDDRNGDGIRGRVRWVREGQGNAVGRFGWRAGRARLEGQIASALAADMGLTADEIGKDDVADLSAFVMSIGGSIPPAPTTGAEIFVRTGCAGCHRPQLAANDGGSVSLYSDLLLHRMGQGLNDGTAEGDAQPGEWRTAPLIGITSGVVGQRRYLHDGRAGSIREAILWHDGEARAVRDAFHDLDDATERRLLDFIGSL